MDVAQYTSSLTLYCSGTTMLRVVVSGRSPWIEQEGWGCASCVPLLGGLSVCTGPDTSLPVVARPLYLHAGECLPVPRIRAMHVEFGTPKHVLLPLRCAVCYQACRVSGLRQASPPPCTSTPQRTLHHNAGHTCYVPLTIHAGVRAMVCGIPWHRCVSSQARVCQATPSPNRNWRTKGHRRDMPVVQNSARATLRAMVLIPPLFVLFSGAWFLARRPSLPLSRSRAHIHHPCAHTCACRCLYHYLAHVSTSIIRARTRVCVDASTIISLTCPHPSSVRVCVDASTIISLTYPHPSSVRVCVDTSTIISLTCPHPSSVRVCVDTSTIISLTCPHPSSVRVCVGTSTLLRLCCS